MLEHIKTNLVEAQGCLTALLADETMLARCAKAGDLLAETFRESGRAFSCGNGGSMSDAMHFAEELSGRYRENRRALPAMAISDPGHISCTANDFGYEEVFSRFIEAHGQKGDVLLCITTSGKSPNILKAAEKAKELEMKVVGLTGVADSPLSPFVDIEIVTPGVKFADRVQELHIKVIHCLVEVVERRLFPYLYEEKSL